MHPTEGNDAAAQREMPRYISHKQVWALEIAEVLPAETGLARRVTFKEPGYAPAFLPGEMFTRYVPVPGDFYVVYADGYKSFSPRKAFLEGYKPEGESFADIKQGLKIGRPPRSDLAATNPEGDKNG